MRGIGFVLALSALVLAPVLSSADDSPERIVRSIYAAYDGRGLGVAPTDPSVRGVFSSRLQPLLEEEDRRVARDGLGLLDFDIFVDDHDSDITDLDIAALETRDDQATLVVSFRNFGAPRQFRFHFLKEAVGWRIDEIEAIGEGVSWRLTGLLNGR